MDSIKLNKSTFSNPYSEHRKLYSANQKDSKSSKNGNAIKSDTIEISANGKMYSQLTKLIISLKKMDQSRQTIIHSDNALNDIENKIQEIKYLSEKQQENSNEIYYGIQIEHSLNELINNLDNIASDSSYKGYMLFNDEILKTNSIASIWVYAENTKGKSEIFHLHSVTKNSLKLDELKNQTSNYQDNSTQNLNILKDAENTISLQRKEFNEKLNLLNNSSSEVISTINDIIENTNIIFNENEVNALLDKITHSIKS